MTAASMEEFDIFNQRSNTSATGNHSSYSGQPGSILSNLVLPCIFYLVFLIGVVGNTLVVYIMNRLNGPKKIADLFVINLAIADLLFLSTMPFWATEFLLKKRWIFGQIFCKVASFFTFFAAYGSVFFLTIMAIDRLGVVVFYKSYNSRRSMKRAITAVVILWVASIVPSFLALYFRETAVDQATGNVHCRWSFNDNLAAHKLWYCLHFVQRFIIAFGVPLVITIVCYVIIVVYLHGRKSKKKMLRQKQDRVTLTICIVIIVFVVCWTPNQVSNFVYVAQSLHLIAQPNPPSITQYYIHLCTITLAWTHSCFNPFLYAFMREDVRHKLAETTHKLRYCRRKNNTQKLHGVCSSPSTQKITVMIRKSYQCNDIQACDLIATQGEKANCIVEDKFAEEMKMLQKSSSV